MEFGIAEPAAFVSCADTDKVNKMAVKQANKYFMSIDVDRDANIGFYSFFLSL